MHSMSGMSVCITATTDKIVDMIDEIISVTQRMLACIKATTER